MHFSSENLSLSLLVVFSLLVCSGLTLKTKKKTQSVYASLANQMIKTLDLKTLIRVNGGYESAAEFSARATREAENDVNNKCRNKKEIKDYFFNVYSEVNDLSTIESEEINEMIEFQATGVKEYELLRRSKRNICGRKTCISAREALNFTGLTNVTRDDFESICPILLFNSELENCQYVDEDQEQLTGLAKWLFGMVLSGIVTLWSWNGAILIPLARRPIYKTFLTYMISLAFGCLLSNSLLKYVPLADQTEELFLDQPNQSSFFKHLLMIIVIIGFFLFERIMKIITLFTTMKKARRERMDQIYDQYGDEDYIDINGTGKGGEAIKGAIKLDNFGQYEKKRNFKKTISKSISQSRKIDLKEIRMIGAKSLNEVSVKFAEDYKEGSNMKEGRICCTNLCEGISGVKPIGYMALFGDGLGNFIDGLSIGASVNQSLALGLTNAIAAWMGNIPQELGDFALLSRAGMTPFQALFYNFMSAQTAYIGCALGIWLGSDIEAARYIFTISAATTMYLSLATLLPEMNEEFENENESFVNKLKITFIQIAGFTTGIVIMVVLNLYEDQIETLDLSF
jgi:zinc transporter ZupT